MANGDKDVERAIRIIDDALAADAVRYLGPRRPQCLDCGKFAVLEAGPPLGGYVCAPSKEGCGRTYHKAAEVMAINGQTRVRMWLVAKGGDDDASLYMTRAELLALAELPADRLRGYYLNEGEELSFLWLPVEPVECHLHKASCALCGQPIAPRSMMASTPDGRFHAASGTAALSCWAQIRAEVDEYYAAQVKPSRGAATVDTEPAGADTATSDTVATVKPASRGKTKAGGGKGKGKGKPKGKVKGAKK